MAIYRVKRTKDFTVVPNALLQNKDLSHKARGLLCYLLSKPDDWAVRREDMVTARDKTDAIKVALQELKNQRYIRWEARRDATGKVVSWEYAIYDEPQPEMALPQVENPHVDPEVDLPQVGIPHLDGKSMANPEVENPHLESQPEVALPQVGNPPPYKELREEQRTDKRKTKTICNVEQSLPSVPEALLLQAHHILQHLNKVSGRHYEETKHILARLHDGATVEQALLVIDWYATVRLYEWADASKYFRPSTLFNAEKFDDYRAKALAWHQPRRHAPQLAY